MRIVGAIVQCARWTIITVLTAVPVATFFAQIDTLYYRSELRTTADSIGGMLAALLASGDGDGHDGGSAYVTVATFTGSLSRWLNGNARGAGLHALADNVARMWDRSILTPVNLFEFNSNPANLEQFGLHPWCEYVMSLLLCFFFGQL